MQSSTPQVTQSRPDRVRRRMMRCVRGAAGLAAMATLLAIAQQAPPGSPGDPYQLPQANRLPDKNQQMQTNQRQVKPAGYEAANTEGTKQIADDAAKLLELAKELKAAVDKTDKDMLSVNVIRKAESIEKLAKGVKEKMKQTVGES